MPILFRDDRGFSLSELLLTLAIAATLMAVAVPVMGDFTANLKLNEAARAVERELQNAKLKAVSSNRPLRARFNCPDAGGIRTVEVLGTAADAPAGRCSAAAYPYPPADADMMTRPNFDGPLQRLPEGATVTTTAIQFTPDGRAQALVAGVPQDIAAPVTITVTRRGRSRTVTINGVGKIQLQ